jgi:hypothetical protein
MEMQPATHARERLVLMRLFLAVCMGGIIIIDGNVGISHSSKIIDVVSKEFLWTNSERRNVLHPRSLTVGPN